MNWTTAASIAEIIGAVGVIASLLYLSVQIKHSTATARRASSQDLMATTNTLLMLMAGDHGTSAIWAKGLMDFNSLDPVERVRFSCLALNLTFGWDAAYHAYEAGQLDGWGLQRVTSSMDEVVRTPGFRQWLKVRRHWLTDEIQPRIDALMNDEKSETGFYRLFESNAAN